MTSEEKNRPKQPRQAKKKNRSPANRPQRKRRQSWWNKTSNTNKIIIAVSIGALLVTAVGLYLNEMQHRREHRPNLVFVRPPTLIDPIRCDSEAGTYHFGEHNLTIKNVGYSEALRVFPHRTFFKIVPVQKTGDPFIDEPTDITERSCRLAPRADDISYQIAPGTVFTIAMRQAVAKFPPLGKDVTVQLYAASCVFYSDEHDRNYGRCNTYKLALPNGKTTFVCGLPITGIFMGHATGHCAN